MTDATTPAMVQPSAAEISPGSSAPSSRKGHAASLGPLLGIILLIVILVAGGIGTFVGLQSSTVTPSPGISSSGPVCQGYCHGVPQLSHDVVVTSPFSSSQVGTPVSFSAAPVKPTWTPSSYDFFFGDGTSSGPASTSSVTHNYASPGSYEVYVQITDANKVVHDNLDDLLPFVITASYAGDPLGDKLQVSGSVVGNSSASSGATANIPQGGSVMFSSFITGPPVNPATQIALVSYSLSSASSAALTAGAPSGTGLTASAPLQQSFTAGKSAVSGDYAVSFSVLTTLLSSGATVKAWSNYTYSVFIGPSASNGGAERAPPSLPPQHPGTVESYEFYVGGAVSLDPSVDYESVGAEVIGNVYETLISYNGSQAGPDPNGFVPMAATCVPGTTTGPYSCQTLYGSDLITNDGYDYTFVINPNAKFYDPYNGAIMNVYPTDVEWSLARTCLISEYPGVANNPGWIQCQALLPLNVQALGGDPSYDSGLHTPYNNTPYNILSSMTVNETGDCPIVGGSFAGAGCITFHTEYSGSNDEVAGSSVWPEFLELISDGEGASIQSCAWDMSQGYVLPGWTSCSAPPSAISVPDNAWDSAIRQGSPTDWNQKLAQQMVGSGPYDLAAYSYGQSYALKLSPGWSSTDATTCVGGHADGCLPNGDQIQATYISDTWETSQTPGEAAYAAGTADFATLPSTDTPTLLNDISEGKIGAITSPTLNIFFTSFNMAEDVAAAQALTTVKLTAPSWMMQDLNMREFLTHTFPYGTQSSQFCTIDGIQYCELYGGTIPIGMGNFYPSNITWPSGQPDQTASDVGGAAWWWSQVASDNLDGKVCAPATPCVYPLVLQTGDPADLAVYQAWAQWTAKISGDAVEAVVIQVNFATLVADLYNDPGLGGFSQFFLGWAPDYPDPSDYTAPMLYPDGTYTLTTAWLEGLTGTSELGYANECAVAGCYLAACANANNPFTEVVTTACQGSAYLQMVSLSEAGDSCVLPACSASQRAYDYNEAEHLENDLAMYTYDDQQVEVSTYAAWINPASFTPNPVQTNLWYEWAYVGQPLP